MITVALSALILLLSGSLMILVGRAPARRPAVILKARRKGR